MSAGKVSYVFQPETHDSAIVSIGICETISGFSFMQGEAFAQLAKAATGCLTAYYDASQLMAFDDAGTVMIQVREEDDVRYYAFARDTIGTIHLQYQAPVLDVFSWPNPALSLHARSSGATGFAETFLLHPYGSWDLDIDYISLPGTVSACNLGIGPVKEKSLPDREVKDLCFAFGACHHYTDGGHLHLLMFEEDLRFIDQITQNMARYYAYLETAYPGNAAPYFIFLYRKDKKFKIELTGTATRHCCLMGYGDALVQRYEDIEATLVHELVHNFLVLDDPDEDLNSLFSEGTADYYATMIPYALGIHSAEETIESLNRQLRFFYSNPWKERSLHEAIACSWTHSYACRVMYGRGLLFLLHLEALLRKYHADRPLQGYLADLMAKREQRLVSLADLLDPIDVLTQGEATQCLHKILQGGPIAPPADFLDGFQLEEDTVPIEDQGFDDTVAYQSPKIVTGLRPSSNACKAGLHDGDEILGKLDEWYSGSHEDQPAAFNVRRGTEIIPVSYLARGAETYSYKYKKITAPC
ncbi:MAG: hypothetical protein K6A77_04930 [Clostridiales bacterium]|nr:hypothetical protein [Clostridiales bacterium]